MYTGDTFHIDKDQKKKITEWYETLPKCYAGAIGGRLTYKFTVTSIGTVLRVKDSITGKEIDVTDYAGWWAII